MWSLNGCFLKCEQSWKNEDQEARRWREDPPKIKIKKSFLNILWRTAAILRFYGKAPTNCLNLRSKTVPSKKPEIPMTLTAADTCTFYDLLIECSLLTFASQISYWKTLTWNNTGKEKLENMVPREVWNLKDVIVFQFMARPFLAFLRTKSSKICLALVFTPYFQSIRRSSCLNLKISNNGHWSVSSIKARFVSVLFTMLRRVYGI